MENVLIHKKIIAILKEVEAVKKDRTNPQQGYKFRGIDDMYNALHPLFSEHGVFITSEVVSHDREERTTAKGGVLIYSIINVKFKFHAEDGSFVESTLRGEAMDSGDKATNKAISTALKYAVMQMFMIPTEGDNDTENSSPEPMPKQQPQPEKEWLKEKQLHTAIERIKAGEKGIIEKLDKTFKMSKAYRGILQQAEQETQLQTA